MTSYSIRFTGSFIKEDRLEALNDLNKKMPSVDSKKLSQLIDSRSFLKKGLSLAAANKLKTRIEESGVECFIVAHDESEPLEKSEKYIVNVREGVLLIAIAVFLSFIIVIFSEGYYPGGDFFYSFVNTMTVFKDFVFCEDDYYGACNDGYYVAIYTKYLILVPAFLALYGVARLLGFFKPLNKIFGTR